MNEWWLIAGPSCTNKTIFHCDVTGNSIVTSLTCFFSWASHPHQYWQHALVRVIKYCKISLAFIHDVYDFINDYCNMHTFQDIQKLWTRSQYKKVVLCPFHPVSLYDLDVFYPPFFYVVSENHVWPIKIPALSVKCNHSTLGAHADCSIKMNTFYQYDDLYVNICWYV